MKKTLMLIALIGGLIAGSISTPAGAAKSEPLTYFLHGRGPVAETYLHEIWLDDAYMSMDTVEPTAAEPSSIFVTNYVRGPNTDCDGNGLLGAVWRGEFSGKRKGDVVVTLHTAATPAVELVVSLYADATGTCSSGGTPATAPSEAPKPLAQAQAAVAPGLGVTEFTFKNVKFKAVSNALLQLHIPTMTTPGQVRILFDSTEYPSSVQFK